MKPNACCNIEENLKEYRGPEIPPKEEKPELEVVKCQVCGCRHFAINAETWNMRIVAN